jgi:Spy/CpxP family protein refolding chaperone
MRPWTLFLTAAILATGVPAANAQVQNVQAQPPAPSPSQPGQSIPDHKLDATAAALDQIADVKETYTKKIEAAPNESDKQQLVDDANKALVKAVTDQGLSVEEYTSIMGVAQADPMVRQKILQRMKPSK